MSEMIRESGDQDDLMVGKSPKHESKGFFHNMKKSIKKHTKSLFSKKKE